MAAIALERTIASAYRFAFTRILSVLGVIWLPSLLLGAVIAAVAWRVWPDIHALQSLHLSGGGSAGLHISDDDRDRVLQAAFRLAPFAVPIWLVGIVVQAMISVGLLEMALGRRQGPVFVYFSLGAAVWRMIGALLLAAVVMIGVVLASCALVVAFVWAVTQYAAGLLGLAKFLSVAVAVVWILYVALRLVFLLPAVVVAEGRIDLARSWALAKGNVWRIVGLVLAVLLPVEIAAGMLSRILFGGVRMMETE
ncbi:MAG TPA: hypothetical protein VFV07_00805, partial [Rhizomicrobium sp.]|nr:hypothetical protein [Rhizomicrobium sp.]